MKNILCFVLAVLLLAGTLSACSDKGDVFETKSYTPDTQTVTGIDIQVRDREVVVVRSGDGQFHIDYAESTKEFYTISVSDSGILTMVSESQKEWTDYIGRSQSDGSDQIIVQVPDAALSTLAIRTTNENITLPDVTVTDELILSNNGGDISFENLSAADVINLENKNGDITGTITGRWDDYAINCTIKKGESNLPAEKSGNNKTLQVTNNNGDIEIEFVSP